MSYLKLSEATLTARRDRMVEEQIIRRGVVDVAVLDAMRAVPRHLYVPMDLLESAYDDSPQPIGYGQTISQPYIVASMTEHLHLTGQSRVLEIGTGSGYQTAVLAEIAREVMTVELIPELLESASEILNRFYPNKIKFRQGDGHEGWREESPFDGIIVTAVADEIPEQLVNQMNINGRMIIPVRSVRSDLHELVLAIRTAGGVTCEVLYQVRFVPLRRG